MKHHRPSRLLLIASLVVLVSSAIPVLAAFPSSTNYRIQMEVIDVGGGLSTSTSYQSQTTIGEPSSGLGVGTAYSIKSGYQQMQQSVLSLSLPSSVTLSPAMPATGGGTSTGSATWTVITDNFAGYALSVHSLTNPALASGGNNFPNYTPATADPDFTFSVPAGSSRFGFSPEGVDVISKYRDNGSLCNIGVSETVNSCWGPVQVTDEEVSRRSSPTTVIGIPTTLKFRADSGALNVQAGGVYSATVVVTALPL